MIAARIRTKTRKCNLPEWFKWEDYQRLGALQDHSAWACLFALRDPNFETDTRRGVGTYELLNPRGRQADLDGLPRLSWRDGVLCHGMKGHETNDYLRKVVEHNRRGAKFVPQATFDALTKQNRLNEVGTHFRSVPGGCFAFSDESALNAFQTTEREIFACTLEFAINLNMPKKVLLKEIGRLIDAHQEPGGVEIEKIPRARALTWSRGIAVFDLIRDGLKQADIARQVAPLWRGGTVGPKAEDVDKKEVRTALKAVTPYVNGEWRTLCGDPLVTRQSKLLKTGGVYIKKMPPTRA